MVRKERGTHLVPIMLGLLLITSVVQLKLNNMYLNAFIILIDIIAIIACLLAPEANTKINN